MRDDSDSTGKPTRRRRQPAGLTRRRALLGASTLAAGALAGCLGRGKDDPSDGGPTSTETTADAMSDGAMATSTTATTESVEGATTTTPQACRSDPASIEAAGDSWRTMALSGVRCEGSFTIASLDAPVVLETFAIWCPTCSAQQGYMRDLSGVTRVSLNVDPNEDAAIVRDHATGNGFEWRYAIAPQPMTTALIDTFGGSIVHPPSTPIVVICPDGSTTFRSGSLLGADAIEAIAAEC